LQHKERAFDDEHEGDQDDEDEDDEEDEGDDEDQDDETDEDEATNEEDEDMESKSALLPFEHPTFDQHLASVRVVIENSQEECPERGFEDKTHWHSRRLLDSKHRTLPQKPTTKWNNPARRNQERFRDFTKYAASLTNAKGNVLEQQVIVSSKVARKQPKAAKLSSKAKQLIEKREVERAKKEESSWIDSWQRKLLELQKLDLHHQVDDVRAFLDRQEARKRTFLEPEVRLYLLTLLVALWQKETSSQEEDKLVSSARNVWDQIRTLRHKINFMTHEMYSMFHDICCKLSIHDTPSRSSSLPSRQLCFQFDISCIKPRQLGEPLDFQAFQLLHCGPFMDRQTGAKPDDRVGFEPDKWQKDVLDELDKNHSVFVVAPTSAGKTFISFYAMSKVLQEDDTGVLVYVAPTKALVNQIGAEIHARFRKSYSGPEQTVWAISTRDVRINDPLKCQILVTVPHFLQIMLLSSSNATTWAPRVKCIIFDEIHSIGHTEDGLVWEQLLLLAPCRIIALSATVGNPSEFADWLQSTQNNMGVTLKLIQHTQRYSDLRKYFYMPADRPFEGLSRSRHKGLLEPKFIQGLHPLHPITSLLSKQRQMPEDLSLEPRDCYTLWRCMVKYSSVDFPVPESLSPQLALPPFIRRSDVYEWEAQLKELLSTWMQESHSPFEMVQSDLEAIFAPAQGLQVSESNEENQSDLEVPERQDTKNELYTSVFPLLVDLHSQNALPALLFNYARTTCEKIAIMTLEHLVKAEDKYKSGASWRQKMADYETYRKLASKKAQTDEKSKKKSNPKQSREETESTAKDVEEDNSPFKRFDPDRPLEQFSFADTHKFDWRDLLEEIEMMKMRKVKPLLLEALKRGVGVHHAGLNRRYRQWYEMEPPRYEHWILADYLHSVERLFRAGFLRVVVATGTLALGINMPCSTVVFCGDSVFLTALNFRQAAGRAGRRGFDLLGNVIFHGIPRHKAYQLMSSRLPDLNGHFPITTSLVLRLFILLHNSKESPYAARAINSLLSQPRINFGSVESKDKVLHHLRFSIEYLRRQGLIGRHGEPIRLASSIAHLYYTENSAFAFHALLRAGYFEELCKQHRKNTEKKLRTLMIVLAHLFGRKSLGYRYKELLTRRQELKSPSVVMLPPLPPNAVSAIRAHNQSILKTYTAYVETFVQQHLKEPECELPLSKVPVGGSGHQQLSRLLGVLEANQSRSAFVGLSGHGDHFKSMKDLCNSVRSGVFLEESVIPHLDVYPDGGMAPLNAYLYDFFCHGCVEPLEVANFISRSDTWFLLNDFSLILATIIVSLQVYLDPDLKSSCSEDMFASDDSSSSLSAEDEEEEIFDVQAVGQKAASKRTDNQVPQIRQSLGTTRATTDEDVLEKWDEGMSDDSDSFSEDADTIEVQGILPENRSSLVSLEVLNAFRELKDQFDEKFHAIFA
jgi:superfamily II RNA helicase